MTTVIALFLLPQAQVTFKAQKDSGQIRLRYNPRFKSDFEAQADVTLISPDVVGRYVVANQSKANDLELIIGHQDKAPEGIKVGHGSHTVVGVSGYGLKARIHPDSGSSSTPYYIEGWYDAIQGETNKQKMPQQRLDFRIGKANDASAYKLHTLLGPNTPGRYRIWNNKDSNTILALTIGNDHKDVKWQVRPGNSLDIQVKSPGLRQPLNAWVHYGDFPPEGGGEARITGSISVLQ